MRCYLGPLNQVTSHSCLCPREDGVLSTVRTHCSTSEEEEMKRLESHSKRYRDLWIDSEIKGERWRKTGECEWENVRQSPVSQLPLSMISGSLKMDSGGILSNSLVMDQDCWWYCWVFVAASLCVSQHLGLVFAISGFTKPNSVNHGKLVSWS